MIRVTSVLALTLVLLAPAARADDTYDLRALVGRKPAAGARCRTAETDVGSREQSGSRNGQPMPAQKVETASARTIVEEVLTVDAQGGSTKTKRTYEAFKTEEGAEVAVTGVVVVLTRAEGEKGHWSFAAAEGSTPLPAEVTAALEREMKGENKRIDKGTTEAVINESFFPAEPQASGATWPVDLTKAGPAIGMDLADADLEASKASGTISGVEEKDGKHWVKARVTMNLMLKKMQGRPMPQPVPMELTFDFAVPAEECLDREFRMTQHMDLSLAPQPGVEVHMLMHNERNERRSTP